MDLQKGRSGRVVINPDTFKVEKMTVDFVFNDVGVLDEEYVVVPLADKATVIDCCWCGGIHELLQLPGCVCPATGLHVPYESKIPDDLDSQEET